MTGWPELVASVRVEPTVEARVQAESPVAPVSPNFSVPTMRFESTVTVRPPAMLRVLKSAMASVPSAMVPLAHLVESDQLPAMSVDQVPSAACAEEVATRKAAEMRLFGKDFMFL